GGRRRTPAPHIMGAACSCPGASGWRWERQFGAEVAVTPAGEAGGTTTSTSIAKIISSETPSAKAGTGAIERVRGATGFSTIPSTEVALPTGIGGRQIDSAVELGVIRR